MRNDTSSRSSSSRVNPVILVAVPRSILLLKLLVRSLQDGEAIFEAFRKVLRKGSPYGYQVLADRAYGKLKETHAIEHSPYKDVSDEDIEARMAELKRKLG